MELPQLRFLFPDFSAFWKRRKKATARGEKKTRRAFQEGTRGESRRREQGSRGGPLSSFCGVVLAFVLSAFLFATRWRSFSSMRYPLQADVTRQKDGREKQGKWGQARSRQKKPRSVLIAMPGKKIVAMTSRRRTAPRRKKGGKKQSAILFKHSLNSRYVLFRPPHDSEVVKEIGLVLRILFHRMEKERTIFPEIIGREGEDETSSMGMGSKCPTRRVAAPS